MIHNTCIYACICIETQMNVFFPVTQNIWTWLAMRVHRWHSLIFSLFHHFFLFTFFLEKGNNIFSKSNQNPFLYFLVVLLEKERRINCYSYTVVHWSHKLNLFFWGKIGKIRRNEANKPVIMIEYDMLSQKKERVTYAFRVKFFSIIINTAPFTRSL